MPNVLPIEAQKPTKTGRPSLCYTGSTSIQRSTVEEVNPRSHIREPFRLQHLQDSGVQEMWQAWRASQDIRNVADISGADKQPMICDNVAELYALA
jgi:hypothetical protein